jgi:hypothetical protein
LLDNDLHAGLSRADRRRESRSGTPVRHDGDEIVPDPDSDDETDLILLRAHAFCCSMLRSAASANSSRFLPPTRCRQIHAAKAWGDLEKDLLARYREAVSRNLIGKLIDCLLPLKTCGPDIRGGKRCP